MKKLLYLIYLTLLITSCVVHKDTLSTSWKTLANYKAVLADSVNLQKQFQLNGTRVNTSAADLNKLYGISTTQTELGYVHGLSGPIMTLIAGLGGIPTWGGIVGTLSLQSDLSTALNLKADLNSPNFTGTPSIPGYVPTSRTINGRALTGNISITSSDLNLGNVTNESKATMFANSVLTGTPTVPGYVPTSTTVNGHALSGNINVTTTDLSLNNVSNTSDANKPVSTATQTALNLKANIDNPTFTTGVTTPAITLGNTLITATGTDINGASSKAPINNSSLTGLTDVNALRVGGTSSAVLNSITYDSAGIIIKVNGSPIQTYIPPENRQSISKYPYIAHVISSSGDTSNYPIPGMPGVIYVDTTGGNVYISIKSIRHNGWVKIN